MTITHDVISQAVQLWHYHKLDNIISKSHYIVGLGSYDIRVAERCAQLLNDGFGEKIIFSGKYGNWTEGLFDKTEAEVFSDHAVACGIDRENIILEKHATNLGENIKFVKDILTNALHEFNQKIIFVTKPNTERRAYATIKKVWPEVEPIITSPRINFFEQTAVHFCNQEMLINEMVGDLQRIKIYPHYGFQIEQEIPLEIHNIYRNLKMLGYDKHLVKEKYPVAE